MVGGITLQEPAIDLAIATAIISAFWQTSLKDNYCIFGELGLSGEIRQVKAADLRKKEAVRLGFKIPDIYQTISGFSSFLKKNSLK